MTGLGMRQGTGETCFSDCGLGMRQGTGETSFSDCGLGMRQGTGETKATQHRVSVGGCGTDLCCGGQGT